MKFLTSKNQDNNMKLKTIFNKIDGVELKESILDPPQKERATWLIDDEGHFNKEIKRQIYGILRKWRDQINFKFDVEKIECKGSLLSKMYKADSDLDVTVYVTMTPEQIDEVWSLLPQGNKIILNGEETQHPIDFFLVPADHEMPLDNVDALYDVGNNKWIKEPVDYKNEIPLNYVIAVSNFFINGCSIALTNYENDKVIYEFYQSIDPETQEISQDEKDKAINDKLLDLRADLDALRMANHMMTAFRHEAYDENEPSIFKISIETTSDNKHVSMNEQLLKLLEKVGMRQKIKEKISECENLLDTKKEEV